MLNDVRVWPKSIKGYYKKYQSSLKDLVKHSLFDNFMTLSVLLNTITLALDRYGIDESTSSLLNSFNDVFTWIFIVEMSLKLLGLGIYKYLLDKMNYLDGSVVLLSIVEIAFN